MFLLLEHFILYCSEEENISCLFNKNLLHGYAYDKFGMVAFHVKIPLRFFIFFYFRVSHQFSVDSRSRQNERDPD